MRRIFFYPLFLTGNERLEPRGHAEPQLVYERRLVLTVDLNFDSSFKGRLICRTMKKVSAVKLVCFSPTLEVVGLIPSPVSPQTGRYSSC